MSEARVHGTRLGRVHQSAGMHLVEAHDVEPGWVECASGGAIHGLHDGRHGTTWAYAVDLPHPGVETRDGLTGSANATTSGAPDAATGASPRTPHRPLTSTRPSAPSTPAVTGTAQQLGTRTEVMHRLETAGWVTPAEGKQWRLDAGAVEAMRRYELAHPPDDGKAEASLYRCAGCGHGKHLEAWGNASVHGSLGADGQIEFYDWDELHEVHEDSIQCTRHPSAVLEKMIDGRWHRWWNCARCHGNGRLPGTDYLSRGRGCPGKAFPFAEQDGRLAHSGWWPSDQPRPDPSLDHDGHVFTPGGDPCCRHCGASAGSITGEGACPGDRHQCPAIVAAGDSDTARQLFQRDEWVCLQTGAMNADFTGWRCGRGHVVTAGHVPPGERHEDACLTGGYRHCPWARFIREEAPWSR